MTIKHLHNHFDVDSFRLIRFLQTKQHFSAAGFTVPTLCYRVMTPDPFALLPQ